MDIPACHFRMKHSCMTAELPTGEQFIFPLAPFPYWAFHKRNSFCSLRSYMFLKGLSEVMHCQCMTSVHDCPGGMSGVLLTFSTQYGVEDFSEPYPTREWKREKICDDPGLKMNWNQEIGNA